ncbi:MAG: type I 3-dehydroquinate dehydratase [Candidatus Korarchaeota archaeon]|nr:type I 3-dehydroquinate dehydratase [Candidatus Korarchaeota archaeon]
MMVVVSIGTENLEQVRKMAKEALLRGSDLVEFRLDLIWENPPELRQINELLKGFSNKAILTWRTTSHGGHGSHPTNLWIERLSFLARYVDIEYDIATKGLKCRGKRIVSWHDPHGTPEEKYLMDIASNSLSLGDIAKVVTFAKDEIDGYRVLKLYKKINHENRLVAFSMGNKASFTRRMAPLLGSPLTYAYLDEPVAEGQLSLNEALALKEIVC